MNRLNGRSISMLGMMGCGKSVIGRMVAKKLGLSFLDSDQQIEEAAGRSVADIFSEYGEEEFRRLETRVIDRILTQGPVMLALGGGAFMSSETREAISNTSISVWLNVDLDVLVERVSRKPGKRPLLQTGDPRSILTELLDRREAIYSLADIRVDSKGGTKTEMRDAVLDSIDRYLEPAKEGCKA